MDVSLTRVVDAGGDVLVVEGTVDGKPVTARGWVSAMEFHYEDDTRDEAGHRDPNATPRPMTDDERRDYWIRLLTEQAPRERVLYEGD